MTSALSDTEMVWLLGILILAWVVHEVLAERYHDLRESDVEEERADHAKPCFVRSWAFKMNSYGVAIDVHIEKLCLKLLQ